MLEQQPGNGRSDFPAPEFREGSRVLKKSFASTETRRKSSTAIAGT